MKKRLMIGLIGVLVIGAGISVFAANTAQWVNVTARVEKEIEINCVNPAAAGENPTVRDAGCAFGTVYPENEHELVVEVNASNSFVNNHDDVKSGVKYDLLWECKLLDEAGLATGPTGTNPCREDLPNSCYIVGPDGENHHCNPLKLDDNIRDYIDVTTGNPATCLNTTAGAPGSNFAPGGPAELEWLGSGVVDDTVAPKCLYHLVFAPPACAGHWNPNTDPGLDPTEVDCNEVISDPDPQNWDRWADLGDTLKIQVYDFTLEAGG
jgi:hypothetical protein